MSLQAYFDRLTRTDPVDPELRTTFDVDFPVVVLSGSIDPQAAKMMKEMGADEYLPKPVDSAQLYSTLSRLPGGVPLDSESRSS